MSQIIDTVRLCYFTGTYNILVFLKLKQGKVQFNFVKVDKIKRSNKYTVLTFKGKTYATDILMNMSLNISVNVPLSTKDIIDHCEFCGDDLFIITTDNKTFIYTNARRNKN